MQEFFEIYNENGVPAGKTASREETHRNGYWHRTAHIWVFDFEGRVLMQLRAAGKDTFPNRWDVSAAGHLDLGESPLQGAKRELKEELGIDTETPLEFLREVKSDCAYSKSDGIAIIDREIQSIFSVRIPHRPEGEFQIQKSEVQKVKWFSPAELAAALKKREDDFVPHTYLSPKALLIPQRFNRV